MDPSVLYNYINDAASRYSVIELIYLWAPTPWMGDQGIVIRAAINVRIPSLAKHYGISATDDFTEFVKLYDEHVYNSCNARPGTCLERFAKEGNWRGVRTAIAHGANFWNYGMFAAVEGGHLDLVHFFIQKGADAWDEGLSHAAKVGNMELIEFFLNKGANVNFGLQGAILSARLKEGGYRDLMQYFINKGAVIAQWMLDDAAESGNAELVDELMGQVDYANINWFGFIISAVESGNIELVDHLFALHPIDLNISLGEAGVSGDINMIQYLLEKGATEPGEAVLGAIVGDHRDLVFRLLEEFNLDDWNSYLEEAAGFEDVYLMGYFLDRGADDVERAMFRAIDISAKNSIKFLAEHGATDWNAYLIAAVGEYVLQPVSYFIEKGANNFNEALIEAINANFVNIDIIKLLIEKGADNIEDAYNEAVNSDDKDLVEYLASLR